MTESNLQIEVVRVLQEKLHAARVKNPSYSLRAFASKLGLSPAAVSEILNGRRAVSEKTARRIADALILNPQELARIEASAAGIKSQKRTARRERVQGQRPSLELSMDNFQAISEWQHFAVMSLVETQGFKEDAAWVAKRLGLTRTAAKDALERLERLGMLQRDEDGVLRATGVNYRSPDEIASLALRKAHHANLELAKNSLEKDPLEKRDFTAVTMAIDPARLPEAKQRIREFRQEIEAFLEGGEKKEVYKFCMQLMPLTKEEDV